jgi:hypothetical protein
MKAVINEKETPVKDTYPCLKVSKNTGNIVLFIASKTGVVVSVVNDFWELGEYSDGLAENDFTPFTGSITLSND